MPHGNGTMTLRRILRQQRKWAQAHIALRDMQGVLDDIYFADIDDNLFRPLQPETRAEFEAADGDELGRPGQARRPKLCSLRSSSALALNFFAPWRGQDLTPLGDALGVRGHFQELRFEQKFEHGLPPKWPNLDVVLAPNPPAQPLAIECKFTEPFARPKDPARRRSAPLADKYLLGADGLQRPLGRWEELGLSRCQALAERLGRSVFYDRLGAGQLLKHILGLAFTSQLQHRYGPVRLLYLWYDPGTAEAREHAAEAADFARRLDSVVDFQVRTYQQVFARFGSHANPAHVDYLRARYFEPDAGMSETPSNAVATP